jgi:hypothetical protein
MKIPCKIVKKFLNYFGLILDYTPSYAHHKMFRIGTILAVEKKCSLNFLIYYLALSYFIDQDKKEILKFVRNKIYGAFLDSVKKRNCLMN